MAKLDIAHAYRNVLIHPADRHPLGMMWDDKQFFDTTLPFGLRSAPKIFAAIADVLSGHQGNIIHYLDDFITLGPSGTKECSRNLNTIKSACDYLGVPLALEKVEGPTLCRVEIDSSTMQLRLPQEKLVRLKETFAPWMNLSAVTKR